MSYEFGDFRMGNFCSKFFKRGENILANEVEILVVGKLLEELFAKLLGVPISNVGF